MSSLNYISLSVQGLTINDDDEISSLIETILNTDAGTNFMHGRFDCNNPNNFTREWFAWSNSLFAELVLKKYT